MTTTVQDGQTTYVVTFERIGRRHNVEPLTATVDGPDHLAELVYYYARRHLGSRNVEVAVDLEEGTGTIYCGMHVGGKFTIAAQAGGAE